MQFWVLLWYKQVKYGWKYDELSYNSTVQSSVLKSY